MIGFGYDAELCDASDLAAVQRQLDEIIPGYEVIAAYAHDWLSDEFSRGTWAIHRPGWYTKYHAEMQRPEGGVLIAGATSRTAGPASWTAQSSRASAPARGR
jgi:monoamine oxidase